MSQDFRNIAIAALTRIKDAARDRHGMDLDVAECQGLAIYARHREPGESEIERLRDALRRANLALVRDSDINAAVVIIDRAFSG